jgi:ABC-2 type transport system ATP-binding protein
MNAPDRGPSGMHESLGAPEGARSGQNVIDVRGLTKSFGPRLAVDHVSLAVPKGTVYGFLGPNGSGKTTTIRMVCGLLKPDEGEGEVLGFDVIRQSDQIKERVGYMTQRFSLYEDLSIEENLEFIARLYRLDNRKQRVEAALADLGLSARATQLSGKLSGGWKQRLALAACMIHEPALLLLDEPTAGVDPKARRDFWDQIRNFADRGVTTLVSTHYMDEAVQCDFIAYIANGRKLLDSPTGEIPARVGLHAWRLDGPDLSKLGRDLDAVEGVDFVARFGVQLHAVGKDEAALERGVRAVAAKEGVRAERIEAGLEEAFIALMAQAGDVA